MSFQVDDRLYLFAWVVHLLSHWTPHTCYGDAFEWEKKNQFNPIMKNSWQNDHRSFYCNEKRWFFLIESDEKCLFSRAGGAGLEKKNRIFNNEK